MSWLIDSGMVDSPIKDKYIAAIYFNITTMTTVGFGDIKSISYT